MLERGAHIGGQIALASLAPMHQETARTLLANYERLLARVELRLGIEPDADTVAALEPDLVVVATGAAPYRPDIPVDAALQAWDVLAGGGPDTGDAVVADWGGDPSGLAAADVLAGRGCRVTLALAAVAAGEGIHQYTRNLYLERLYLAGVRIEHHLELVTASGGTARFRNLFAPELEAAFPGTLVLALGRVPVDALASELAALGMPVQEAGDCRSPRSLEEAILEGTLAARVVSA